MCEMSQLKEYKLKMRKLSLKIGFFEKSDFGFRFQLYNFRRGRQLSCTWCPEKIYLNQTIKVWFIFLIKVI